MVPSKTYLKFKETRSQEDLETLYQGAEQTINLFKSFIK